jgi:hypothetical protein
MATGVQHCLMFYGRSNKAIVRRLEIFRNPDERLIILFCRAAGKDKFLGKGTR